MTWHAAKEPLTWLAWVVAIVGVGSVLLHCSGAQQATAAECAGPELERFIRARVCGEPVEPPASIAARVAWCVAQREVAHLFGASYCAGRDAGADR